MKTHIGVDSQSKLIHSVAVTHAYTHDSQVLDDLLHVSKTKVWNDSAYSGQKEVLSTRAPYTKDYTRKKGSRHRTLEINQMLIEYQSKIFTISDKSEIS